MRKVIASEMVSIDGFFAGPNGELDWHVVDAEFNEYADALLGQADTLLFGRVTYEMMAGFWPTPHVISSDPIIAKQMNSLRKIVFSKTLAAVDWNNSELASDVHEEVVKLKSELGRDLVVLGSGSILSLLSELGLIDEYRILVNPVVLGSGKPLFTGISTRLKMKLINSRTFESGLVLLSYVPAIGK